MKSFITTPTIDRFLVSIGFSTLSVLAVAPARAVVMDFNGLPNVATTVGDNYIEDGFIVTSTIFSNGSGLATLGNLSSTALSSIYPNDSIRLTQVGGGAFNLSSINLTNQSGNQAVTVTFTGTKADNSTTIQSFTTDAVLSTLQTFNFNSNFTNLVRVNWIQAAPYHQFDNINVTPTAVPEPLTLLGTLLGAGSSIALKRKLAKRMFEKL